MVTALFLLSLIPRVKNIQTGEYPTVIPHLQVLQAIQVWDEASPGKHAFLPVQTWNNPNDKSVTYFNRLENARGDNYYVSYPPFAFVLAYGFCKLFGLQFSVLSITILNLLLQWLAAWCVFLIAQRLLPQKENRFIFWPGLAAAAVFIGNPAGMRIFSQVYFSEAVGTALLCVFCYFAVLATQERKSFLRMMAVGLSLFLLVYTEWIGIFAGICFGLFWGIKSIKDASFRPLLLVSFFSVVGAILLFMYQLDVITDNGDFIANIKERYLARSGMRAAEKSVGDTVFKAGFGQWLLNTLRVTLFAARWFFPVLLVGAIILYNRQKKNITAPTRQSKVLLYVIILTVAVNFLALLNFSLIHSYTWAKWGLPIGLATAFCVYILMDSVTWKFIIPIIIFAFFATDLVFYQSFGKKDEAPEYWKEQTAFIKQNAQPDETIYITTVSNEVDPTFHLTYYCKRNMKNVPDEQAAIHHFSALKRKKMIWFYFNQNEGKKEFHRSF